MRKKLSNELPDPFDNAAKIVFQNRPAEIMKESVSYQYMFNKAKIEGERYLLLSHLDRHFDSIPQTVSDRIKAIDDEQILSEILELAFTAQSKAEFLKAFRALKI